MSVEAPSAPKRARSPWARAAVAVVAGATVGFLYYRFVGCRTGTCVISSNPYVSTLYGAFVGFLLGKPKGALPPATPR
jgi:hypothetical protein